MQYESISKKFSRKQNELMVIEFRLVVPPGVVIGVEGQERVFWVW